jgi:MFS family permease
MVWAAKYLKESPQFAIRHQAEKLLAEGRTQEAHELAGSAGIDLTDRSAPVASAFKGESLRSTTVIGFAFLLSWLGVLAFAILGTSLLTAEDGKAITFDNALVVLIISNATAFLGYLFHGWLGDRIGRRNTIAIGWLFSGLSFGGMLLAPDGNYALIVALYSAGLFFLIGPYSALLFFNGESFPVHTRATGGAIINAAGQIGAVLGGLLITLALTSGLSWTEAAFWFGCVPIFASGVVILGARNVDPRSVRLD